MNFLLKRPLCTILSSVIVSYLISYFLPVKVLPWLGVGFILLAVILLLFCKVRKLALLIFLPVAIAILNFYLFTTVTYQPMKRFEDHQIELQGQIIENYRESTTSYCFVLRPDAIIYDNDIYTVNGDVMVYVDENHPHYTVGSRISCLGEAFADDEDGFSIDFRATNRQFLSVYCTDSKLLELPDTWNVYKILSDARKRIKSVYLSVFSKDAAALVAGITLGDTEDIDDRLYGNFKNSGVSHTLAVSGMHLAFLTTALWFLFALLSRNLYLRSVLQLIAIWGFAALTGFSPSCIRAAVMLTVFQIGILVHKESDAYTSLSLAVVFCCLRNPYAILNPGLALSATATLGILLLTTPINALFPKLSKRKSLFGSLWSFVGSTVSMSVAATIGTLPIMIMVYQSVSLLAPLTNVLIIPAIQALFLLGFVSIVLGWIAPIAFLLQWLAQILYEYCDFVTAGISRIPFCTVYTGSIWTWLIVIALFAVLYMLYLLMTDKCRAFLLPTYLIIFSVMIGCFYGYDRHIADRIEIDFVDVGQGNTAIISSQHDAILIDCGGSGNAYREINRCISQGNVRTITTIYLTHLDQDHVKYLLPLVKSYGVKNVWISEHCEYSEDQQKLLSELYALKTDIYYVSRDTVVNLWGKAKLAVLSGHIDFDEDNENLNSLVYKFSYGDTDVLFPGDIEAGGEKQLYQTYRSQLESDVFLVPHHGSENGSSIEFLTYVNARVGIISVSDDNSYGLPSPQSVRRIQKYTSTLLRTDRDGSIRMFINDQKYWIKR